jgi:ABC-type sugar transport system substrate-binding protein
MKKAVLICLCFLMGGIAVFAGGKNDNSGKFTISFDMADNKCPYCLKFANYIEQFSKEKGITPLITQSDNDIAKQIAAAESSLVQGAKVIAGIWVDKDAGLPVVEAARGYDAVVVSTLTSLSNQGGGYEKYIYLGSENYDGGYLQGEWLAKNLPRNTKIWYMGSMPVDQQGIDRRKGMEDALAKNGRTDLAIVASEYTDNRMDRGVDVMETWLQAYDNIECLVGSADLQVIGAITVAKNAGRMGNTIWVGFDGQDVALQSIKAGEMSMTVFQDAESQARAFVDLCVRIRDGEAPAGIADINIPFKTITKENVDQFKW